jgi:phosphoglycerate dehydrogenase-like enzyme
MTDELVTVLVPDEMGMAVLSALKLTGPALDLVKYDVSQRPTSHQREATVLVTDATRPSRVDRAVAYLHQLPKLRLVQTLNAGYETWVGRLPAGVALSNGRGAHGGATAEWVMAVLLAHYRELVSFASSQTRGSWDFRITDSLLDKRVAIIGAGDIGTTLRAMLEPFGVHVTLVGRAARTGVLSITDFHAVQSEQDVVVLALPVTTQTVGLVDAEFLAGLKDGAVLVNAGRGPLVRTDALLAEAEAGRLRAILDVTDPEPLPAGHPLWSVAGVVITPHIGGATVGLGDRAWRVAAEQIEHYIAGNIPTNLVIPAA